MIINAKKAISGGSKILTYFFTRNVPNVNLALDDVYRKLVDVVPDFVVAVEESVSSSYFSAKKLARA